MEKSKIERINQLAKKKKTVGLSADELVEQKALYKEYIGEFRSNLTGQLDNMVIQNPDGTKVNVKNLKKKK
ncbi:MAG: DUF896 domain-containing protein [Acutalibacteraceae bacterium]|nr:DUF896 domain-containing protein [Acutalibacteraceae bacterium]